MDQGHWGASRHNCLLAGGMVWHGMALYGMAWHGMDMTMYWDVINLDAITMHVYVINKLMWTHPANLCPICFIILASHPCCPIMP